MSARFGRAYVELPRPLPDELRDRLEEEGFRLDEAAGLAERHEPGEVDLDDPHEATWPEGLEHAWYLGVHERDDIFVYSHWAGGALVRHLEFCGSAAGWTTIEGLQEPWELDFLRSKAELERGERYLELVGFADGADRARKVAELRRIHEGGLTPARKGTMLPACSPEGWALALPAYLRQRGAGSTGPAAVAIPKSAPPAAPQRAAPAAPPAAAAVAQREQLARALADPGQKDAVRARAAQDAARSFPGLIGELRRARAIPARAIPADARPWDASNPMNQDSVAFPSDDARTVAALSVDPAELDAALAGSDKRRVVLALELLATLAELDPEGAGALEPKVRPLVRDGRSPEHGPGIPTVRAVSGFFARALPVHAAVHARSSAPWEALVDAMDAAIGANVVQWLARHFLRLPESGIAPARVAETLLGWIEDRARPPATRARARDVLKLLADNAGGPSDARKVSGRPWADGLAALKRGDDAVLRILEDPAEAPELKARIKSALARWMPGRPATG